MKPSAFKRQVFGMIALGCIYAIFALPLFVDHSSFFPYVFPKAVAFEALVIVATIACALSLFVSSGQFAFLRHPLTICFGVWVLALTVSALLGNDFWRSFWSTAERMNGIYFYLHLFVFYLICLTVLRTDKDWRSITVWSLIISVIVAIGSIAEFDRVASGERLHTSLGNPLYASIYALIHGFIALYYLLDHGGAHKKGITILCSIALVANGVVTIFAASRSASIAMAAIGIYFFVIFHRKIFNRLTLIFTARPATLAAACAVLLVSIGAIAILQQSTVLRLPHIDRVRTQLASDPERITLWRIGVKTFLERPLSGVGLENFTNAVYKDWEKLPVKRNAAHELFDRSHNAVIDMLATTGLVASVPFFLMAILIGLYIWRAVRDPRTNTRSVRLFCGPVVLAYGAHSFFSIETPVLSIVSTFFFAYISFSTLNHANPRITDRKRSFAARYITAGIAVALVFLSLPGIIHPVAASRYSVNAFQNADGNPGEGIRLYQLALDKQSFVDESIRLAIAESATRLLKKSGAIGAHSAIQDFIVFSLRTLEEGASGNAHLLKWYIKGGPIYLAAATIDAAYINSGENFLKRGLSLVPKHPQLHHNLARLYLAAGRPTDALREVDLAIANFTEEPMYFLTRIEALLALKKFDEAFANFTAIRYTHPLDISQARVLVELLKQLPCNYAMGGLSNYVAQAIRQYPSDLHFRIAHILLETNAGDRSSAQAILEDIKRISPDAASIVRTAVHTATCKATL